MHAGATKRERKGDKKSEGETEREMESAHDPYDMKAVISSLITMREDCNESE